jgi:hypothetical protein
MQVTLQLIVWALSPSRTYSCIVSLTSDDFRHRRGAPYLTIRWSLSFVRSLSVCGRHIYAYYTCRSMQHCAPIQHEEGGMILQSVFINLTDFML